jgi:serine/threonine protein kinase
MSPEQVRGAGTDHRSDIFSFGAVLYEMLAGRRAFRGDSAVEVMNAILKEEPPELARRTRKSVWHWKRSCGAVWRSGLSGGFNRRATSALPSKRCPHPQARGWKRRRPCLRWQGVRLVAFIQPGAARPGQGGKRQISTAGGVGPYWRGDGRELYYHALDGKLMAAPVTGGASFKVGTPVALFEFRAISNLPTPCYSATRDWQRFLLSTIVKKAGQDQGDHKHH